MTAALVAGLLAGYAVALPVGAVATYLVALTARTSLRIGAAAALGVATADGLYALAAAAGGDALAWMVAPVAGPLRVASALVLILVAAGGVSRLLRRHRDGGPGAVGGHGRTSAPGAYLGLLGITILNPATVVYFAALVVGHPSVVSSSAESAVMFVLAVFVASASWQVTLAGSGAALGRVLTSRRGQVGTTLVSSMVITAQAVHLLLS